MAGQIVRVGKVEITALSDGSVDWDLCNFYPAIPADGWRPYSEFLTPEGKHRFNIACFLVRSDGHTILVDTGLGVPTAEIVETTTGQLLDDLKAKGIRQDEIDMVVFTHLHRDHVGWNLRSQGDQYEPYFPKARYIISKKEWEACRSPEMRDRFVNSPSRVWPLEELGLMELVEGEHALTGELTALPTPGHTPGHMSILVSSQGQRALILGDIAHSVVQVHETEWVSRVDIDPKQTRNTRRHIMDRLEREGLLVAAAHFPTPGFGKVVRRGGRRQWQALPATD